MLRSVAKHSPELAQAVVDSGALEVWLAALSLSPTHGSLLGSRLLGVNVSA